MDRYIGKRLDGRYEVLELVGTGGMANVYRARDLLNGSMVAVKILKEEYLSNEEFCRRFRNESRAISQLNHKNIIKVFDVSSSVNMQYMVMEYIDGITLKDYIEQQGVVEWKEAVHFITQILRALQHAHDNGVIHRDIKPQNIMLLETGEIKVTDFGIARFARSETHTTTDKAIGSVHYIAPEQARGAPTDERADLYSVGVMLYEMLTGRLPFEANDAVSVAVMQLQADPKMPREIMPSLPEALEEITIQAMQKDPNNRYQSAADMLLDIDDFKRNPSIRFEYRYMIDDSPTRYMNAINNTKRMQEAAIENEKSPVIPVLTGIATSFILIAVIFGYMVLNIYGFFDSCSNSSRETSKVPNFVGMDINTIVNYSENGNDFTPVEAYSMYSFETEYVFNSEFAQNIVFDQSPKANKTVYSGSKIKLTISLGAERPIVPDFNNTDFATYSQKILESGLTYRKIEVYNDTVPNDYIINTNPLPRTDIDVETTIEVYVSIGPKPDQLVMINCQNMTYEQAAIKLEAMGINKSSIQIVYTDSEKVKDTILEQEPAPFTPLEGNVVVKLVLSNGTIPRRSASLNVALPAAINSNMQMEIKVDDATVYSATVNPAATPNHTATFEGAGVKTAVVYLNGFKYREYTINFTSNTNELIRDYGFTTTTASMTTTTAPTTTTTAAPVAEAPAVQ